MKNFIYILYFICLLGGSGPILAQAPQTIIDSAAVWKYWAFTGPPATNNWKGGGAFNDTSWPSGAAPLGYSPGRGDGERTRIPTGCPMPGDTFNCGNQKYPTIYFRRTFTISNINAYKQFVIHFKRDDGIVLYINGAEVKREFMPGSVINYATPPTAATPDEGVWQTVTENVGPRAFLHSGENVIAAEVHQFGTSNDLRFNAWVEAMPATTPALALLRGPYLQMGTTSTMTVRWSTGALAKGQVRYDTVATNLTVTNPSAMVASEPVSATGVTDHQVTLRNLLPNKKYYYIIESAGPPVLQLEGVATTASLNYFYTAPVPGTAKKTRIWALGDFGSNNARQDSVIASFKTFKEQNSISYVDLWLWMGDNAYDWGLDEQYQENVFDKTKARYDWIFRQTPFYATPGNHDYQNNFNAGGLRYDPHPIHYYNVVNNFTEAADGGGGEPSHREEYYSFNYNNIHVVSLDSYGFESGQGTTIFGANGPQVTWLKQDLAKAQADPKINWIIAYWHHPPYTMGTYNSDRDAELTNIRTNFLPILEQYRVDMVINGHSHVYERSRLMKNHYDSSSTFSLAVHNPFVAGNARSSGRYDGSPNSCFYYKNTTSAANEGVIYVVNGAGGRSGNTQIQPFGKWPHPAMEAKTPEGGSMYIEVDGKRLDAKFINEFGVIKDKFTIIKDQDGFAIPATDGLVRSATCECTDNKGFTHYADQLGNLLLSIKKYNYPIGTVGVAPFDLKVRGTAGVTRINAHSPTNYVHLASYGYRGVGAPWIAFNRYWTLTPGTELSGNSQVIIRQYYKEADLTALNVPYVDDPMTHGNLKPYKVNDEAAVYTLDPTAGHASIPQAGAYNRPGAWIYDARVDDTRGAYPTTHWWMPGEAGNGNYYGDYVVGRLKGSGGFGAPSNFQTNPSGHKDRASQMWYYLVTNTAPPSDWKTSANVTGWGRGYLPLGYSPQGEDGELTQIPNGCPSPNEFNPDCQTKNITTYFKGFLNYGSTYYQSYILNYRRNDGVIIYIDGQEVLPRDPNMLVPSGDITPTTAANANTNELEWRTVIIPASAVNSGLIAAEVHQSSQSSSDLHFNLELVGTPDVAVVPIGLRAVAPVKTDERSLVVLYPNPVEKGKVFFTAPLSYQTLQLTDLQGKTYRYISQPGTIRELDVSSLAAGTYILISQSTDALTRYKIVKL